MLNNITNLDNLSEYIEEVKYEKLPSEIINKARLVISDTLGVIICGYNEIEMKNLSEQYLKDKSKSRVESSIYNKNFDKINICTSSFLNTTAACFVELDELSHSALHILPIALAIFETKAIRYKDLITAFIVGFETQNRINAATSLRNGVYPHGNSGHIGAFITLAKLFKLDKYEIKKGILCAASLPLATSYAPTIYGSNIASVFASFSGYFALNILEMIKSGAIDSYENSIDNTYGEILGYNFEEELLDKNLGETYFLNDVFFKFYPVCGMCYPAISALLNLCDYDEKNDKYFIADGYKLRDIDQIEVLQFDDKASRVMIKAFNKYSAKFSLPFAISLLLYKGSLKIEDINLETINSQEVKLLEDKVTLSTDKSLNKDFWSKDSAKIIIYFKDGSFVEAKSGEILGSPQSNLDSSYLLNKFIKNTEKIFTEKKAIDVWKKLIKDDKSTESNFDEILNNI